MFVPRVKMNRQQRKKNKQKKNSYKILALARPPHWAPLAVYGGEPLFRSPCRTGSRRFGIEPGPPTQGAPGRAQRAIAAACQPPAQDTPQHTLPSLRSPTPTQHPPRRPALRCMVDRIELVLQNKRSPNAHSQFQGKTTATKTLTFLLEVFRVLEPYTSCTALTKNNATRDYKKLHFFSSFYSPLKKREALLSVDLNVLGISCGPGKFNSRVRAMF